MEGKSEGKSDGQAWVQEGKIVLEMKEEKVFDRIEKMKDRKEGVRKIGNE